MPEKTLPSLLIGTLLAITTTVGAVEETPNLINEIYQQFCAGNFQSAQTQLDNIASTGADFQSAQTQFDNFASRGVDSKKSKAEQEKAIKNLRQAIFSAQNLALGTDSSVLEILYRLQKQLGDQFKSLQQWESATYAYRQASYHLKRLRNLRGAEQPAATEKTPPQSDQFKNDFETVYYRLVDILLTRAETAQRDDKKNLLSEVIDTLEVLKQAELQDYFVDDCLVTESERLDTQLINKVDKGLLDINQIQQTAIFYPIIFPEKFTRRIELLVIRFVKKPQSSKLQTEISWETGNSDLTIAEIRGQVERFRDLLEKGGDMVASENGPDKEKYGRKNTKRYGKNLYDLFMLPIQPKLTSIKTLVYVPDGILRTIPITAFFYGQQFVIEKEYAIATIPGLTLTKSVGEQPLQENPRILLGGMSKAVKVDEQSFGSLTKTEPALTDIATLYPNHTTLREEDFLIDNLKNEMHSVYPYTRMHLHTHGTFQSGKPKKSFLLTYELVDSPDRRLTMKRLEDIFSIGELRQSPIELLTLSACQTAKGDEKAALGLAGIALKSGAKSVIATLWNADESRTTELMYRFHKKLHKSETISKAQALQQVQQELLELRFSKEEKGCDSEKEIRRDDNGKVICYRQDKNDFMLPRYWAPFILIGDWF